MGSNFYRAKIGLYVLVIIIVGSLFAVRVNNAWQRINYSADTIIQNRDIQISLHYPAQILSAKSDATYPLTLSFYYTGDTTSPRTYEISLESPTLLFVDANGVETTPSFQFTSDQTFLEQSVYVRPYLSDAYPQLHVIIPRIVVNGQAELNQPAPIEITVEAEWNSFFSLAAASLVEISVATALITWIVNTIDASSIARKERIAKIRETLNSLSSLSYLEQMGKICELGDEVENEHLDGDMGEEIIRAKSRFKEEEFFRVLGEQVRQDKPADFSMVQKLHGIYYPLSSAKDSTGALGKILNSNISSVEEAHPLIMAILKLWDDFDANAKDLIVGTLKRLSQKIDFSPIPAVELQNQFFAASNRRRLLRDTEIQQIFPHLVDPRTGKPLPLGYDADWMHYPKPTEDPKILDWLKGFTLVLNPFGVGNFKNCSLYPDGFARPDRWEDILFPLPQHVQCQTPEDAKILTFLMRSECLSRKIVELSGNETYNPGKQLFPIMVSFGQNVPCETPLVALVRSAANTWMEILPFSPDAMLDLPSAEQEALPELLCWTFGSTNAVINLLKRAGLKPDKSGNLLIQKIEQFQSRFSSTWLPQDLILLSWLKIKPPDLNSIYLNILLDEIPLTAKVWWLEQFRPLISTLLLNGIITKAFSSSYIPATLPLPAIRLNWSDKNLETSLNSQFEAAMDKTKQREMGQIVDFRALFGSDTAIGYFETEYRTIHKLISASHNSLARMLNLGNRLLQHHCENRTKDGAPEKYLYVEDLEAILKTV